MKDVRIMVVGDLMLDRFVYGDVERISPEGPIPVLSVRNEDTMLGGAGNVLTNLTGLGVTTSVFSVTGNDDGAKTVRTLVRDLGVADTTIFTDETRPTILKTRFVARSQQLLRTDVEKTHALSEPLEKSMLDAIRAEISNVRALILSDYGKGVLNAKFIERIIALAASNGVPVLVDPKGKDFSIYRGADVITPNRKELSEASGMSARSDADITQACEKIIKSCAIKSVLATRSEDGMTLVMAGSKPVHTHTQAKTVFDVSGAGDTVIAVMAAALSAGADLNEAAQISNLAAGVVVGKAGTSPITTNELIDAIENPSKLHDTDSKAGSFKSPLLNWSGVAAQVKDWQEKGLKVGFTNGCFDILHYGHVNYLAEARKRCDRLVVGLNHDISVKILKGPTRPVNDQLARATVLGALASVDIVVLFGAENAGDDNTPSALIAELRPDVFFKGGDYSIDTLPEAKIVQAYGGTVDIMNLHEGYSTTGTIEKMRQKM